MAIRLSYSDLARLASAPKPRVGNARKPARLREFLALRGGKPFPPHFPPQPVRNFAQPRPFLGPPSGDFAPLHGKPGACELGPPLGIREVAELIGCSPWTIRQTLIPRGLPHFRSAASGRLIFYTNQIVGWIESQQFQGGN
jgi:hypothetical protein